MGVICKFSVENSNGIFKPGDKVEGVVEYSRITKAEKIHTIILSLIGQGQCIWTERTNYMVSHIKQTTTYNGTEDYVKIQQNIHETDGESVVPKGIYRKEFCFILPENIPSTYSDSHSTISYQIKLELMKSGFFRSTKTFATPITVRGYLQPYSFESVLLGLEKRIFSPFSSKNCLVCVHANIEKTYVKPGENIKLVLKIQNDSNADKITIGAELIEYTTYAAHYGNTKNRKKALKKTKVCSSNIYKYSLRTISLMVPTLPKLLSIQNSKIIIRHYKVKVTIQSPWPHCDTSGEIPIVIGNTDINIEREC